MKTKREIKFDMYYELTPIVSRQVVMLNGKNPKHTNTTFGDRLMIELGKLLKGIINA